MGTQYQSDHSAISSNPLRRHTVSPMSQDSLCFVLFIGHNHLKGKGIGMVDINLLVFAQLTGIPLWTADKRRM